MRYPGATRCASRHQAGCGNGFARSARRGGRPRPQPVDRRDRRSGPLRGAPCATVSSTNRAGCPTSSSWAWGAAGELQAGRRRGPQDHLAARRSLGISARSVTVSTVGLAPAIPAAGRRGHVGHAGRLTAPPDDELRDTLVPGEQPLVGGRVLEAARYYADTTGRRVSIEYALIPRRQRPAVARGHARRQTAGGTRLAGARQPDPLNPTPGSEWDASPKPVPEREFVARVRERGIPARLRHAWAEDCSRLVSWPRRPLAVRRLPARARSCC